MGSQRIRHNWVTCTSLTLMSSLYFKEPSLSNLFVRIELSLLWKQKAKHSSGWSAEKVHFFHMYSNKRCWNQALPAVWLGHPSPWPPISDSKGPLQSSAPCAHSNHWKEVRTHPSFLGGRHGTCILANHTWDSLQQPLPNLFLFWQTDSESF